MEAGLLDLQHLRAHLPLFERFYAPAAREHVRASGQLVFNEALKRVLNALVGDLLEETVRRVRAAGVTTLAEVRDAGARLVAFSPAMEAERLAAKRYLYAHLYGSDALKRDHAMAAGVIRDLFGAWVARPELLAGRVHGTDTDQRGRRGWGGACATSCGGLPGGDDGFVYLAAARGLGSRVVGAGAE